MHDPDLTLAIARELNVEVEVTSGHEREHFNGRCIITQASPVVRAMGLHAGDEFNPQRNLNIAMELAIKRCMDFKIHQITVVVYPQPDVPIVGEVGSFKNKRECLAHTICQAAQHKA